MFLTKNAGTKPDVVRCIITPVEVSAKTYSLFALVLEIAIWVRSLSGTLYIWAKLIPSVDEKITPPPSPYTALSIVETHILLSEPISISLGQCFLLFAVKGRVTSDQLAPPSTVLYKPYSGPPK